MSTWRRQSDSSWEQPEWEEPDRDWDLKLPTTPTPDLDVDKFMKFADQFWSHAMDSGATWVASKLALVNALIDTFQMPRIQALKLAQDYVTKRANDRIKEHGINRQLENMPTQSVPDTIPWGEAEQDYYRHADWKPAGADSFHEDASQALKEYEALARDIIKTLPPEEWPRWVKNYVHKEIWGEVKPIDLGPFPSEEQHLDNSPSDLTVPDDWDSVSKVADDVNAPTQSEPTGASIPANYTDNDPLDMEQVHHMVNDLHSEWWLEDPATQRQAIANAFRAALTSPRQNLQWNSIVYQDMQGIPPDESNPDVFESAIRRRKGEWDRFGQQAIDTVGEHSDDPDLIQHVQNGGISKYMPGIWGNVRNAATIGPYVEQLREAALEDVARGGTGVYFRQKLLDLDIPGIGPKIAAFVWLLLCPKTSRLATIDIHMMRHMGEQQESPKDYSTYLRLENRLDAERKQMGYEDVPLGAYQWALWDKQRTPGYHQDHTPLRPLNPTHWSKIDWAPQVRVRKQKPPEVHQEQMQLASTESKSDWKPKKNYLKKR